MNIVDTPEVKFIKDMLHIFKLLSDKQIRFILEKLYFKKGNVQSKTIQDVLRCGQFKYMNINGESYYRSIKLLKNANTNELVLWAILLDFADLFFDGDVDVSYAEKVKEILRGITVNNEGTAFSYVLKNEIFTVAYIAENSVANAMMMAEHLYEVFKEKKKNIKRTLVFVMDKENEERLLNSFSELGLEKYCNHKLVFIDNPFNMTLDGVSIYEVEKDT